MPTTPSSDRILGFFNVDVQYRTPIYQRRYVWNEDNWDTLWEDIRDNSDKIPNAPNHFTGTIVTQSIGANRNLPTYEIIDGQQRLTTFQIIFCVIRDLCNTSDMNDIDDLGSDLKDLLMNASDSDGNRQPKLLPTEYDAGTFNAVVHSQPIVGVMLEHRIYKAYDYFHRAITTYIGSNYTVNPTDGFQPSYRKLCNLYQSITNNFTVVQIDASDRESQKIFETLNATGRQLSEFDYLRNNLFLRVGADLGSSDARREARYTAYKEHWEQFETYHNEWKDHKLESFLWMFLEAKLGSEIFSEKKKKRSSIKAFNLYREYSEGLPPHQGAEDEISQLTTYGLVYRHMTTLDNVIGQRMQFYKDLGIIKLPPAILYVIGELSPETSKTEGLLKILESYIVQSLLIGRSKDKVCRDLEMLLRELVSAASLEIHVFRGKLEWPNITSIKRRWRSAGKRHQYYKLIRYILYRIECKKREDAKSHILPFSSNLLESLEHVMPRSWKNTWPLDSRDRANPRDLYLQNLYSEDHKLNNPQWQHTPSRDGLVQQDRRYIDAHELAIRRIDAENSIGNLTPMDKEINERGLSHNSFADKKSFFQNHPALAELVLTREIFMGTNHSWDVDNINEREEKLLEDFLNLWPLDGAI